MAAPAADKYSEAEGVVETVIKIFSERTDPNTARDAGREICEIKRRATARHAELVRSIRELTNEAERARRRLAEGEQLEAGSAVREELLSAKARAERSISRMRQENLALQQQIGTAETRASELAAREQGVRQQELVEVPRARHTISLYANISSIRWDFGTSNVKGFLASGGGSGIKAFEMDPAQQSGFEMTNRLWELMGTS
mmetsp:Transcript_4699/g.14360  ORF Transcript_4699/g.14360 Transcript_4699/m.14360 type:complete len:201 (-) Transcript_4699:23-625(-)